MTPQEQKRASETSHGDNDNEVGPLQLTDTVREERMSNNEMSRFSPAIKEQQEQNSEIESSPTNQYWYFEMEPLSTTQYKIRQQHTKPRNGTLFTLTTPIHEQQERKQLEQPQAHHHRRMYTCPTPPARPHSTAVGMGKKRLSTSSRVPGAMSAHATKPLPPPRCGRQGS